MPCNASQNTDDCCSSVSASEDAPLTRPSPGDSSVLEAASTTVAVSRLPTPMPPPLPLPFAVATGVVDTVAAVGGNESLSLRFESGGVNGPPTDVNSSMSSVFVIAAGVDCCFFFSSPAAAIAMRLARIDWAILRSRSL